MKNWFSYRRKLLLNKKKINKFKIPKRKVPIDIELKVEENSAELTKNVKNVENLNLNFSLNWFLNWNSRLIQSYNLFRWNQALGNMGPATN
jgi:hypothetical protein